MKTNFVFIGLGNPGKKYEYTRHNFGFQFLDSLRSYFGAEWTLKKDIEYFSGQFQSSSFVALRPLSFMNLSGQAVFQYLNYYKLLDPETRIYCFYDELDIPLGRIQCKQGGGSAGHNGVKSMVQYLGAERFIRIRLGIGRPLPPLPVDQYVLQDFKSTERQTQQEVLSFLIEHISLFFEPDPKQAKEVLQRVLHTFRPSLSE